jgi:uncharacterized protein YndB with AHSA1/START domain
VNDTVDREHLTLAFQRTLQASPEEVFDAWTTPEQITEWWDPSGARLAACTVDLRVGGSFWFENQGHSPAFSGVYKVVDRPSKLVFEAMGALGTVTLEAEGKTTLMRVTIRCSSPEHFEMFVRIGAGENTGRTLDNLVARFGPGAEQGSGRPC